MDIKRTILVLVLFCGLILQVCNSEVVESTKDDEAIVADETESDSPPPQVKTPLRPFMRRRIVKKRIINGEKSNVANNVTVSMSVREEDGDKESTKDSPTRRPLFSKFRSSFMNRTRPTFMTTPVGIPTTSSSDPVETPSASFKLKMRPRLPFGKIRTTANTITDEYEDEEPSAAKSSTTAKPFGQKKFFKSKVTPRKVISSTSTTTTEEAKLDDVEEEDEEHHEEEEEHDKEQDDDEEADPETKADESALESANKATNKNSSMIIIPVPPSQRKPYHPVIMQVTKTPTTPESLPETKVVTYKLNKMFVPMGIYGKVLPKSATQAEKDLTTRNTVVSTPLPFLLSGQNGSSKKTDKKSDVKTKSNNASKKIGGTARPHLKTPSPEIKVKGHRSHEVEDQVTSGDSSRDYARAVAYATSQKEHHIRQQRQWESMMEKLKQKHRKNIVDTISLTYDYKPSLDHVSLTTEKVNVDGISLTTENPLFNFNSIKNTWGNLKQKQTNNYEFQDLSPPHPNHRPVGPPQLVSSPTNNKSIFQTITSAAASLPGLIHDGLTSLTGYPNPFDDDTFQVSSSQIKQQIPPPQIQRPGPPAAASADNEALEFFRKRPYLLHGRNLDKDNFIQPEYSSGFKPVAAPEHFASQYYASTPNPKHVFISSTPTPTIDTYVAEERDPLYQGGENWPVTSTVRTPKQFGNSQDSSLWKAASSLYSQSARHPFAGFGITSTTTPRPSYLIGSSTPKSFTSQWMDFNRKYTKTEIDEAKERIFSMFSSSNNPVYDAIMYMKPPAESKQSTSNTGAFDDLLKMFRMGFSFGAGHTASSTPMVSYAAGMYNEDQQKSGNGVIDGGWKPVSKNSANNPVISLNAGITFGGKPSPTPMMAGLHASGTHYSSSTQPFYPKSQYKEFPFPKSHYTSNSNKAPSFGPSSTTVSYAQEYLNPAYSTYTKKPDISYQYNSKPEVHSYFNSNSNPFASRPDSYSPSSFTSLRNHYSGEGYSPSLYTSSKNHYSGERYSPSSFTSSKNHYSGERYNPSSFAALKSHYSNDPAIEIIPSSVFFKQKGNMNDIAAIIKPPELSSDLVKAALPPQISMVPQLSYPTQQLIQNPHSFTSLSQLQQYFATAQPTAQPTPTYAQGMPGLVYLGGQQGQQVVGHPSYSSHQQGQQVVGHSNYNSHPPPVRPQSSQGGGAKPSGDPSLGFSDFKLPSGLDPDIASLIQTELEKDDVPDEYRQDFLNAKEEEKKKAQSESQLKYRQPQGSASSLRVTVLKPHESHDKSKANSNSNNNNRNLNIDRRSDKSKPDVKFHEPIPITPTMLTPAKGKPIRASPVPRYVVELARKLKNEKDVQGIVRVSTKRERGPPIEYLYPVRG